MRGLRMGADRIPLLAPPFADFVHAECLAPARARVGRLRLDVVLGTHGWRLVRGGKGPKRQS
jgi:hypothetical protein